MVDRTARASPGQGDADRARRACRGTPTIRDGATPGGERPPGHRPPRRHVQRPQRTRDSWPAGEDMRGGRGRLAAEDVVGLQGGVSCSEGSPPAAHARGAGAGRRDGRCGERCTVAYLAGRLKLDGWTARWFPDTPARRLSAFVGHPIPGSRRCADSPTGGRAPGSASLTPPGRRPASSRERAAPRRHRGLAGRGSFGDLNATAVGPVRRAAGAGGLTATARPFGERGPRPPPTTNGTARPTARASTTCSWQEWEV